MGRQVLEAQHHNGKKLTETIVKGAISGGVGVIALDQVANYLYTHESKEALEKEKQVRAEIGASEMGPVSIGVRKMTRVLQLDLNEKQLDAVATVIHYSLGVLPGAAFAVLLDRAPKTGAGKGTLYGLALFVLNDELLSVKLGWAAKPNRYPWQAHIRGLLAHVALGVATYQTFRLLNRIWK